MDVRAVFHRYFSTYPLRRRLGPSVPLARIVCPFILTDFTFPLPPSAAPVIPTTNKHMPTALVVCRQVQGSAKRQSQGLVNFVPALAYHFCPAFPAAFTQTGDHLSDEPCADARVRRRLARSRPSFSPRAGKSDAFFRTLTTSETKILDREQDILCGKMNQGVQRDVI